MAANLTLCKIIAYLSVILTFLGTIGAGYMLKIGWSNHPTNKLKDWTIAFLVYTLVSTAVIFIVSTYLIIGINNKRHQFVAPWVFVLPVCLVLSLLKLIFDRRDNLATTSVSIVLQACMWYPIFNLYRELRSPYNKESSPEFKACPANTQQGADAHQTQSTSYHGHQQQTSYPAQN